MKERVCKTCKKPLPVVPYKKGYCSKECYDNRKFRGWFGDIIQFIADIFV